MAQLLVSHPVMCFFCLYLVALIIAAMELASYCERNREITEEIDRSNLPAQDNPLFREYILNWLEQNQETQDIKAAELALEQLRREDGESQDEMERRTR